MSGTGWQVSGRQACTIVPDHAPVERAHARVVRAICAPWCATAPTSSVSFAARHSGSNAQQGVPIAWSLLAMKVANRMSTRNNLGMHVEYSVASPSGELLVVDHSGASPVSVETEVWMALAEHGVALVPS